MLSSSNYPSKHRLSSLFPLKHQPPSLAPSKRLSHQRFMKKNIETLFGGSVLFSILSPFYNYHHAVYQLFNIVTVIFKCASKCPTLLLEFTVNCPTHCPTTIFKHATIWTFDHITSISKYTGDRPLSRQLPFPNTRSTVQPIHQAFNRPISLSKCAFYGFIG